jgi:3-oxoacyl-[acyl-carrier protein] reductase
VTGGGRGIGHAIAERLGAAGALVAVNYAKNARSAVGAVAAIEATGGQAFAIQADIGDVHAIAELYRRLDATLVQREVAAAINILVNNARLGIFGHVENTPVRDSGAAFQTSRRGRFLYRNTPSPGCDWKAGSSTSRRLRCDAREKRLRHIR